MSRKARESAATQQLLQQIEKKTTCRLTVGAGLASVVVYVLKGEVVAATSPADERQILTLVQLANGLPPKRVAALEGLLSRGESIFGHLVDEVDRALIERFLSERFRANLAEYVGNIARPTVEPIRSVFVDNLQFGLDSRKLIDECADLWESEDLAVDALIVPGPQQPSDAFGHEIVARVSAEPLTVGQLMYDLPWEPLLVRHRLHQLVERGVLLVPPPTLDGEDWTEDDATESSDRGGRSIANLASASSDLEDDSDAPTTEAAPPPEPTDDRPKRLQAWLDAAHRVDEDELDFFEDHDSQGRGGGGVEGRQFSTDTHNLDRVSLDAEEDDERPIEVDEAPASRFGAPTITEDECLSKIEVTSEVLRKVLHAFDEAEGPGRGRAVIQLLLDGSPPRYSQLFSDLQLDDTGDLPGDELVSNLMARPPTEHRLLLNQALSDLIERALSNAADELPDDAIDELLETTAGYRSRLGL